MYRHVRKNNGVEPLGTLVVAVTAETALEEISTPSCVDLPGQGARGDGGDMHLRGDTINLADSTTGEEVCVGDRYRGDEGQLTVQDVGIFHVLRCTRLFVERRRRFQTTIQNAFP